MSDLQRLPEEEFKSPILPQALSNKLTGGVLRCITNISGSKPYVLEHFHRISKMSKLSHRGVREGHCSDTYGAVRAALKNIDLGKCHTYANVAKEAKCESARVSFISAARHPPQICPDPLTMKMHFSFIIIVAFIHGE